MKSAAMSLPEQKEEVLVQARIPKDLRDMVDEKLNYERRAGKKANWKTFLIAACEMYLQSGRTK